MPKGETEAYVSEKCLEANDAGAATDGRGLAAIEDSATGDDL